MEMTSLKVTPCLLTPLSVFLAHRAPGGSHGRPERQSGSSAISYDCSEEELMASIEREYCR